VFSRVFSGVYPRNVCSVIYQNADHYLGCQFTFACDGKRKVINERGAWARANRIARQTLEGLIYVPQVGKSTHYYTVYAHPNWVHEMHPVFRHGVLPADRLGQRLLRTGLGHGGAGAEQEKMTIHRFGPAAGSRPGTIAAKASD
jgi:hypothetical protein